MFTSTNAVDFIKSANIGEVARFEGAEVSKIKLDQLPEGVVAGNTLLDYSGTSSEEIRSAVSLAMIFAGRAASNSLPADASDDEVLAAYSTSLNKLGFAVSGTALNHARFSKKGIFVHEAIIPFLTIALGGAAVGPIILAALSNLQKMDSERPWIALFDRQSRRNSTHEMHFAAVSSDAVNTTIRLVVARLNYQATDTTILFAKIDDVNAEFESATMTVSANNQLLSVIGPKLQERMSTEVMDYIDSFVDPAKPN